MKIKKIISGGQTGADRAALDFAIKNNIPHGGWIPKGRLTEEGHLSKDYHLKETKSSNYEERTEKNVVDSDGTMIFYYEELSGGSLLTYRLTLKHKRPVKLINLDVVQSLDEIQNWITENKIGTLNIAGLRASYCPTIYEDVERFLGKLFKE